MFFGSVFCMCVIWFTFWEISLILSSYPSTEFVILAIFFFLVYLQELFLIFLLFLFHGILSFFHGHITCTSVVVLIILLKMLFSVLYYYELVLTLLGTVFLFIYVFFPFQFAGLIQTSAELWVSVYTWKFQVSLVVQDRVVGFSSEPVSLSTRQEGWEEAPFHGIAEGGTFYLDHQYCSNYCSSSYIFV